MFKLNAFILLIVLFVFKDICFSQESATTTDKSVFVGITSIASLPFFPNLLPCIGYNQYSSSSNLGFTLNAEYLVRLKLDNFMVLLAQAGVYGKIRRNSKLPIDLGGSLGIGVNSLPYSSFFTSAFISIPVWKLKLKCQPTLVVPSLKSSYISLNVVCPLKLNNK